MIVHADNFSIYGSNIGLLTQGVYASANRCSLADDPDGLSPGKVLFPAITGGNAPRSTWRFVHPGGSQPIVGTAFRIWMPNLPNADGLIAFVQLRDASNTLIMTLEPNADGSIEIYSYNDNSTGYLFRKRTPIPAFTAKGWYHFEMKYEITGAGLARVEVRIEGITVIEEEDVPVRGVQPAMFSGGFYDNTAFVDFYLKDLVIWDGQGTRNNDFLGSVLVTNLKVDSDVSLNWTPSTGTDGYTILDNTPPNDAQYLSAPYSVEAPNFPEAYEGTLSSLPIETTSVKGVITYVRAAKSDGGDGSLQVSLVSNPEEGAPVEVDGADRPITVAQTYWRDIFEIDPATSSAWTPASVNDANIKINRTT